MSKLVRSGSSLSWIAPFSLNLTNVEPDIIYCVEVYNITCGRSHLINDCNVMETSFVSDYLQVGYSYEYTVVPRSNVDGVMNGTSLNIKGMSHLLAAVLIAVYSEISIKSENRDKGRACNFTYTRGADKIWHM